MVNKVLTAIVCGPEFGSLYLRKKKLDIAKCIPGRGAGEGLAETRGLLAFEPSHPPPASLPQKNPAVPDSLRDHVSRE